MNGSIFKKINIVLYLYLLTHDIICLRIISFKMQFRAKKNTPTSHDGVTSYPACNGRPFSLQPRLALTSVVHCPKVDNAIHRIHVYSLDSALGSHNIYPVDSVFYGLNNWAGQVD